MFSSTALRSFISTLRVNVADRNAKEDLIKVAGPELSHISPGFTSAEVDLALPVRTVPDYCHFMVCRQGRPGRHPFEPR